MRIFFFISAFFLNISSFLSQDVTWDRVYADTSKKVLVAAHRGDWRNYVENSVEGVNSCIEHGIDIIEIDVQRTKDGHFILMHDATINRTTNGKGYVKNYTLEQLTKFKLKNSNGQLTDYNVPSLDTILKISKGKVILNLDKSESHFKALIPLVDSLGCSANVILKGSGSSQYFNTLYSKNTTGTCFMPICSSKSTGIGVFLFETEAPVVELLLSCDTTIYSKEQGLEMFKSTCTRIWYNALFSSISGGHSESKNALNAWDWFITHDAYIIQTDYPFHLMEYLIAKNLHPTPAGHVTMALNGLPNAKILPAPDTKPIVVDSNPVNPIINVAPAPQIIDSIPIVIAPTKVIKPVVKPKVSKKFHTVRSGDTLSEIADKYHIGLSQLLKLNPKIRKSTVLRSGMKIRVK